MEVYGDEETPGFQRTCAERRRRPVNGDRFLIQREDAALIPYNLGLHFFHAHIR
ncbi:hypothetical protein FQN60_013971 [Etheostoma spectabile]|uniref:Uncharacterized protein n=1 Tax=Etheostoma spectabile TaxID=54343 RepID=A0A5J5CJU0_9PERO|nr:hypothetical protein FQN60_013971 [Etheostoma spectabile]